MEKIEVLDAPEDTRTSSPMAKRRFRLSKKATKILVGVVVVLGLFGALTGMQAFALYKSGITTYRQAKVLSAALKQQDISLASTELQKTKVALSDTQKKLGSMFYLKLIPIASFYYNDADHMMKAGAAGLDSAEIAVKALEPYADVLGLKGGGSFVGGSAEDRIRTAVLTLGKITPRIDDIAKHLDTVKSEINQVNPKHYPKLIFGERVQTQLTLLRDLTDQGVTFVNDARPLVKVLPELLGEKKEKKYLVLFQNDAELRATGGFITAYAIFRVDKGNIFVDKSEDIYALDNTIPKTKAPRPIAQYLPKVSTFNLRDSNLSPDYVESMKTFYEMYQKSPQEVAIDGIIALDTHILVSTIKILDDEVSAGGLTFNTKPDPRCWDACPQVIYELEDNISRPVNYIKTNRKGLLGELLQAIMKKALSSSPKEYWGPLIQSGLTQAQQKHVMFYLFNKDAQQGIEALNAAGRIQDFEDKGDYLHINDVNFAGAKSNLFITQKVENKYEREGDSIIKTVTIEYENPQPHSGCNLERGDLCLNAENRNWLRLYVPKGSEIIQDKSKGSQVKLISYEELGKTVIEGFLTVRPEGKAKITIAYKLPFTVSNGKEVPVLIQKQPGSDEPEYTTVVKGRSGDPFKLLTDTELKIKL